MKVKLTAPDGKKLRDTMTLREYTEVITDEKYAARFVVADSEQDPVTHEEIDGATLDERVADLEDAVIELAEIIAEG